MIPTAELNDLLHAPGIEDLWDMHQRRMAGYGFDRIMYGATRYRSGAHLGDAEDFVILTNHSTDYTDVFIGEGLYHHAPMVRWALDHDGPCSWSLLRQMAETGNLSAEERKVFDFNLSMGVRAGYSISFRSVSPRTKGAIALTAEEGMRQRDVDAMWETHGEDILLLNNIAHLRILSLPYTSPARTLTARQREVLGWVGDGKTVQDIALLMGLTGATVEKHLRLARDALCVETTAQAVLKASFQNQIFMMEA
ncbi:LuxR family transcriptional regulator [Roseovarius sp. SCSIO 43702]|uniref:LuxR family transcriptional regulator n=1 Tax=Roseovarius sp. SCSIO 43702 TaxID=2823043 RepID=UPI001C73DFB4|nr:LuxR family transcriptional regulator [Roseovarius sp. SCSIO 43702]QYX55354.1 LuxR family transcriptional regulator [Roseovarius sp. SCSIO 43702]